MELERTYTIGRELGNVAHFNPGRLKSQSTKLRPGKRPHDAPVAVTTSKLRTLYRPNRSMSEIQHVLVQDLRQLWRLQGPTPWVTGALPGSSPKKNALRHAKKPFGMKIDLRNAYDNVVPHDLVDILAEDLAMARGMLMATVEEQRYVEAIVGDYCACFGGHGIRTGAPASPDLFNRYALEKLDRPILELIRPYGGIYTRYLDDLTISANRRLPAPLRREIREVIFAAGFDISWWKGEVWDLKRQPSVTINGVGLRANGRPFVPRPYLEKVKRLIWVSMYGQRSGVVVSPEVAMGHIGGCLHIMGDDQRLWNATDHRFLELVNRFRRHFDYKPFRHDA